MSGARERLPDITSHPGSFQPMRPSRAPLFHHAVRGAGCITSDSMRHASRGIVETASRCSWYVVSESDSEHESPGRCLVRMGASRWCLWNVMWGASGFCAESCPDVLRPRRGSSGGTTSRLESLRFLLRWAKRLRALRWRRRRVRQASSVFGRMLRPVSQSGGGSGVAAAQRLRQSRDAVSFGRPGCFPGRLSGASG